MGLFKRKKSAPAPKTLSVEDKIAIIQKTVAVIPDRVSRYLMQNKFVQCYEVGEIPEGMSLTSTLLSRLEVPPKTPNEANCFEYTYTIGQNRSEEPFIIKLDGKWLETTKSVLTSVENSIFERIVADLRWNLFQRAGFKVVSQIDYRGPKVVCRGSSYSIDTKWQEIESTTPATHDFMESLTDALLEKEGFPADFRRIGARDSDACDPLRLVWHDVENRPIEPYILRAVTYGDLSLKNPEHEIAPCEASFLVSGKPFQHQSPKGHPFGIQIVADRVTDNLSNQWTDSVQVKFQIARALRPLHPGNVCAIISRRRGY